MTGDTFSHVRLLETHELWFFLEGDEAEQTIVDEKGSIERRVLDSDHRDSLVSKNTYRATRIKEPVLGYTLFSTIMSPRCRDDMDKSGKDGERVNYIKELKDLI